jgi:isocitrate dehydrogenase
VLAEHRRVDEVAHDLVRRPEDLDVILAAGVDGDVLGDLAAALVGGRGVAASASVGHHVAIFEAAHGPGRDIAGRDRANPTAMLLSAVMMLRHVGAFEVAGRIERALEQALRSGVRTRDLGGGAPCVGTSAFADDVIARLEEPRAHDAFGVTAATGGRTRWARLRPASESVVRSGVEAHVHERTVGMDVFVQSDWTPAQLGAALGGMTAGTRLCLRAIWNRGVQVYPDVEDRSSHAAATSWTIVTCSCSWSASRSPSAGCTSSASASSAGSPGTRRREARHDAPARP